MSSPSKLGKLLAALPAILLMTMMNVFISASTSGVVLIQLLAGGCQKYVALGLAVLGAIITYTWLVFNHKLRNYINSKE
jgi:hypothetical protein